MLPSVEDEAFEIDTVLLHTQEGSVDELRNILKKSPESLYVQDTFSDGLLSVACWHGRENVARMLIDEFDVHVNEKNKNNVTPLHRACTQDHTELALWLISRGANPLIRDRSSRTPGDYGNLMTRTLIREKISIDKAFAERKRIEAERIDELEFDEVEQDRNKVERIKRQSNAVPIAISGALCGKVNGIYNVVMNDSQDWPLYIHRENEDVYMHFDSGTRSWVVMMKYPAGMEKPDVALARIMCSEETYPEMRMEGSNNIIEYIDFTGKGFDGPCSLVIETEEVATAKAKLDEILREEAEKKAERDAQIAAEEASKSAENEEESGADMTTGLDTDTSGKPLITANDTVDDSVDEASGNIGRSSVSAGASDTLL
jgi:hypothetical protein